MILRSLDILIYGYEAYCMEETSDRTLAQRTHALLE